MYDILYTDVRILGYPQPDTSVLARRVEAIDRAHAILWWLRTTLGINIDPVTMFDRSEGDVNGFRRYDLDCGCSLILRFETHRVGRFERWKLGGGVFPLLEIENDPCDAHNERRAAEPTETRNWNGTIVAWPHDPKRPAAVKGRG